MSFARAAEGQNKVADDLWRHPSVLPLHRLYTLVVGTGGELDVAGRWVEGQKLRDTSLPVTLREGGVDGRR